MGSETMQTTSDIESRLERARSESMDIVTIAESDDLTVLNVINETKETQHTVVPEALHCSCEDHTYRDAICKHLLFVADNDPTADSTRRVRQAITDELTSLTDEHTEIKAKERELRSQIDQLKSVRSQFDTDDYGVEESEEETSLEDLFG